MHMKVGYYREVHHVFFVGGDVNISPSLCDRPHASTFALCCG